MSSNLNLGNNIFRLFDTDNTNSLLLLQLRFERNLDVDGSRLFAQFKLKENQKWVKRNLYPTVLCEQVANAENDYRRLSKLFALN